MLEMKTDLLNDFLTSAKSSSTLQPKILPETTDKAILHGQQQPCYERAHFDVQSSTKASKSKNLENAFDDLLTSQGFQATIKSVKSLSEMKREEEIKGMDPVKAKVKDWTNGKERNIRALLGSLNDVLWPSAENWVQPSIGDLLTSQNIKKYYRKACLVVHPDKQVGTENEALARSIFTELNDAWTCFENAGSMSM
ncbi:unnamed protein product [Thelazia callipaeda]|uniref:J domain-containing protein n=1 Tax=Thelazia callipaeda TaxID=103827 RepID=A0A0N5DB93_THECL|nr:unnamed protein product [Thelazia callipaeda]